MKRFRFWHSWTTQYGTICFCPFSIWHTGGLFGYTHCLGITVLGFAAEFYWGKEPELRPGDVFTVAAVNLEN